MMVNTNALVPMTDANQNFSKVTRMVDGNKRIGILSMLLTLQLNDIFLAYTQPELVRLGLSAASGEMRYAEILEWICAHKEGKKQ